MEKKGLLVCSRCGKTSCLCKQAKVKESHSPVEHNPLRKKAPPKKKLLKVRHPQKIPAGFLGEKISKLERKAMLTRRRLDDLDEAVEELYNLQLDINNINNSKETLEKRVSRLEESARLAPEDDEDHEDDEDDDNKSAAPYVKTAALLCATMRALVRFSLLETPDSWHDWLTKELEDVMEDEYDVQSSKSLFKSKKLRLVDMPEVLLRRLGDGVGNAINGLNQEECKKAELFYTLENALEAHNPEFVEPDEEEEKP